MAYSIGIDLGGTKIESILLSPQKEEMARDRRPTEAYLGYERILENIVKSVSAVLERLPKGEEFSVGMGIPGMVDPATELVRNANTTVLIGKPLQRDLEVRLGCPLVIENDANCFALAESRAGAVRDFGFVFGIILGTGCGGGLCVGKEIRRGLHGICGEWGHVSLDPDGPACYCGGRGCIETLISGSGVEAAYERLSGRRRSTAEIFADWRRGDLQAGQIVEKFFDNFGRALALLVNTLDPDAIVLGGGLSNLPELYTIGIESLKQWAFYDGLKTPVLKNQLGDSAGVIGAAWLGAGLAKIS